MAISLTTKATRGGVLVNANSADVTGVETIQAAPSAGESINVHNLSISSVSAITVTVGEGATPTTAVLVGPIHMAANSQYTAPIASPVALTAATALTVDASAGGNVTITAQTSVRK